MNKVLLLTFTLSSLLWAFHRSLQFFDPQYSASEIPVPILNSYATVNGQVILLNDASGFYVNVNLATDLSDYSDSDFNPATVQMMVGLYTSRTVLVTDCLSFIPYNCTQFNCSSYSDTNVTIDFPYFTGAAISAQATVQMTSKDSWSLKSNASIVNSCNSSATPVYGKQRYGVLGMGILNSSGDNFQNTKSFSVTISSDLLSGHMTFGPNPTQSGSTVKVASFESTRSWHIHAPNCIISTAGSMQNVNASIIFDLNADIIGFPLEIFKKIILTLENAMSMKCSGATSQPICYYDGSSSLPNITIAIDEDNNITLPSSVYVQQFSDPNVIDAPITLNLKALDPSLSDESYVTEEYANYIILDAHVMSSYYFVFDGAGSKPRIELYSGTIFHYDSFWIEVLIGSIAFLAIVFCCCFCNLQKKENKKVHATDYNPSDLLSSSQVMFSSQSRSRTRRSRVDSSGEQKPSINPSNQESESGEERLNIQYSRMSEGFSFQQTES